MPVGGDVTRFFIGLMGVLSESLRAGRLPLWNDLWGYGFPGLAESQMGVYYPPHLVLYRFLGTETAYVVSLVVHTLWGGLGAFVFARGLGISSTGSVLAGFTWSASGFFVIHLAHPWGYTTGCWMPWALAVAWSLVTAGGPARPAAAFLLSLVLVLQVLPGHFQLAFQTLVSVSLMILWAALERWAARWNRGHDSSVDAPGSIWRGARAVWLPLTAVFPLAALQLWPTARLARLAASQRDFEYLSGFAATPLHLVNYVAPGLFHRSGLWRPLVWDPFHTSPEENLAYVGLVPLFLAGMTVVREFRRDAAVRLLAFLVIASLVLSLGPYAPGFRLLIAIPGFSFFRAPARWTVVTALGLALLAGKGFDRWQDWPRAARSLARLVIGALLWTSAVVAVLELALWCTSAPGRPEVARVFQKAFAAMPWSDDPGFDTVAAKARLPAADRWVPAGIAQSVFLQKGDSPASFVQKRGSVYVWELWETALLLAALGLAAVRSQAGGGRSDGIRLFFLAITFFDLWGLSRHRLLDVAPLRPLVEQSPVLARLAREPRGTRVLDAGMRNLTMLVGKAPVSAYRTLDLPAVGRLTDKAREAASRPPFDPLVREALRVTGTGLRVIDPVQNRTEAVLGQRGEPRDTISDPLLAGWLFGQSWVAAQRRWIRNFSIMRCDERPIRAWLIPRGASDPPVFDDGSEDPGAILAVFKSAHPLEAESSCPENWTINVETDQPSWVIISQLADPQWQASWCDSRGKDAGPAEILQTFHKAGEAGGWQRVAVPGPGCWMLRLEYDAADAAYGLAISVIAWMGWLLGILKVRLRAR
jgi:hypothetical protein